MIDTLKFKVELSELDKYILEQKLIQFEQKNLATNKEIMKFHRGQVNLPSHNADINVFLNSKKEVYLEFSLPKFQYGENVHLIHEQQYHHLLNLVRETLCKEICYFPPHSQWQIYRLDLCMSWKFESQKLAEDIMRLLQSFDYPKKKKYRYDTSVMFVGPSYAIKFYLKQPEFKKHDFHKVEVKKDYTTAFELYKLAEGVVRFEISIRKRGLTHIFKQKYIYNVHIKNGILKKLLGIYKEKIFAYTNHKIMTKTEALNKLLNTYSRTKALRLYSFYKAFYNEDENEKAYILETYERTQIYRNKKDLKDAGIGIPDELIEDKIIFEEFFNNYQLNPFELMTIDSKLSEKLYI